MSAHQITEGRMMHEPSSVDAIGLSPKITKPAMADNTNSVYR